MDTMNPKFKFLATKYGLPDVECWAMEKLGVSEGGVEALFSSFVEGLQGVSCNVYSIAEYINDFFKIERHIKRQGDKFGADITDVLLINHGVDGTMLVAIHPRYLNMLDENLLPPHLLHPNRTERTVSVQYDLSGK